MAIDKVRREAKAALAHAGLPRPNRLPEITSKDRFPSDLTALTDKQVRQQHSYWSAQLAFAEWLVGQCAMEEISYRVERQKRERRFRLTSVIKTKWENDAALAEDPDYAKIDRHWHVAEAKLVGAKAARDSFEHYVKAASRELTARFTSHDDED